MAKILAAGANHLVMDFGHGIHDTLFVGLEFGDILGGRRLVIDTRSDGEVRAWVEADGRPLVLVSPIRDILREVSDKRLAAVLRLIKRGARVRRSTFEAIRAEVLGRATARQARFEALYAEVYG